MYYTCIFVFKNYYLFAVNINISRLWEVDLQLINSIGMLYWNINCTSRLKNVSDDFRKKIEERKITTVLYRVNNVNVNFKYWIHKRIKRCESFWIHDTTGKRHRSPPPIIYCNTNMQHRTLIAKIHSWHLISLVRRAYLCIFYSKFNNDWYWISLLTQFSIVLLANSTPVTLYRIVLYVLQVVNVYP